MTAEEYFDEVAAGRMPAEAEGRVYYTQRLPDGRTSYIPVKVRPGNVPGRVQTELDFSREIVIRRRAVVSGNLGSRRGCHVGKGNSQRPDHFEQPCFPSTLRVARTSCTTTSLYKAIANTAGVRASRGFEAGTLGTKVRNARLLKVPFMTVIGAKEEDAGALSARTRDRKQNRSVKPADFVQVRDMVSVLSDGYIRALGPAG